MAGSEVEKGKAEGLGGREMGKRKIAIFTVYHKQHSAVCVLLLSRRIKIKKLLLILFFNMIKNYNSKMLSKISNDDHPSICRNCLNTF
jgi:hypothetical protein